MGGGAAIWAALLTLGAGCHREGPYPGVSMDQFTYVSRTWEPKTITVMDTRTNEPVWTVDIPVGQQLVVGFSTGTGPNEYVPDEIVWGLMPAGRMSGPRKNRMPCPPSYARRLDMAIRPTPEPVWSDVPGAPNYRPEPRPVRQVGGRVVQPIEDEPIPTAREPVERRPVAPVPPAPEPGTEPAGEPEAMPDPEPATMPTEPVTEPAPEQPAPTPAPSDEPDYTEVPPGSSEPEPEPEEPPIDIPE